MKLLKYVISLSCFYHTECYAEWVETLTIFMTSKIDCLFFPRKYLLERLTKVKIRLITFVTLFVNKDRISKGKTGNDQFGNISQPSASFVPFPEQVSCDKYTFF